jgi:hypothetical protein
MYSRYSYVHIISAAHALCQVLRKVQECKQVRSSHVGRCPRRRLADWCICIVRRLNMRTNHTIFFGHSDLLYEI